MFGEFANAAGVIATSRIRTFKMSTPALPDYHTFVAPNEPFDSAHWRSSILNRCRWFSQTLWAQWFRRYTQSNYVDANRWLTEIRERLKLANTGLLIDSTDEDIMEYARIKTKAFELNSVEAANRYDKKTAVWVIKSLYERTGFEFPLADKYWNENYNTDKIIGAIGRIIDPHWLARQFRQHANQHLEQLCRELGLVNRGTSAYLSSFTLRRVLTRRNSNRKLLEKLIATNDLGQSYTLAELSDLGVSNPINRRHELMTRLNGFEEWADLDSREWKAMFYTLTAPSKYHPMKTVNKKIIPNEKYNNSTPKETQDYLTTLWERARAKLDRNEIERFGFRVVEPHHDGTPHWHLLLFVRSDQENSLTSILRNYALVEDGNEPGARAHRFESKPIDKNKGSATGYVAKYISKNIDGYRVSHDDEAQQPSSIAAIRAACWASTWGIKQFQQLGGPPVTVWRELRRLSTEELASQSNAIDLELTDAVSLIHQAAHDSDWKEFTERMGGATCKRKDFPLRSQYFIKPEQGKYLESISALFGLSLNDEAIIRTRLRTWAITLKRPDQEYLAVGSPMFTGPPSGPLEFYQ